MRLAEAALHAVAFRQSCVAELFARGGAAIRRHLAGRGGEPRLLEVLHSRCNYLLEDAADAGTPPLQDLVFLYHLPGEAATLLLRMR